MLQSSDAPQSIGGVLDDGFRLFRASLSRVAPLAFAGTLAGQLPNLFVSADAGVPAPAVGMLAALLASMLLSLVFYGAAVGRMDAVARGSDLALGDALALGLRRLLPLLVFSVLYVVVLMVGFVLLVIPGILFGVSLMFGFYVILLEGKGPLAGLADSHRLVWGSWWRTLVIVSVASFVVLAAYLLVIFVIAGVLAAGQAADPGALVRLFELVLGPLLGAVVGPLFYALSLATYYDLKLRRSGADLEARFAATVGT